MNKSIFTLVLVLILFCVSLAAENENCGKLRLGINFGYFSLNDSTDTIEPINPEYLTGIFYGADAGFLITQNVELTATYSRIYKELDALNLIPIVPSRATFNEWLFGGYYHFMGICEPLNVKIGAGLDFGSMLAELDISGAWIVGSDQTGLGFWISAGVETAIAKIFNVGMEIIYISLETEEDNPSPSDEPTDVGGIRIKGFVKIRI